MAIKPNHRPFSTAAGSGGAYLHSGVAVDLVHSTFVGNRAGEEGLAVLSLGIAENISHLVFDSNTVFCSPGTPVATLLPHRVGLKISAYFNRAAILLRFEKRNDPGDAVRSISTG